MVIQPDQPNLESNFLEPCTWIQQDRFRLVPVQPQILLAPILEGSHV